MKFIHIADSHLGRGFALAENGNIKDSTRLTWERVIDLCRTEKADFLLIAGDSYENNDDILRSTMFLRDKLTQLNDIGIHSFIIHGNHDPLSSWKKDILSLPDGVTQFSDGAELKRISTANGSAVVAGISYADCKQKNNSVTEIKSLFNECDNQTFRIALIHCSVGGKNNEHDTYAPATLNELAQCGADYVALGHIHNSPTPLRETNPRIAYAGCLQGTSIKDTSIGGAWVITTDGRNITDSRFVPLAYVHWLKVTVNISSCNTFADAIDTIVRQCKDATILHNNTIVDMDMAAIKPERFIIRLLVSGKVSFSKELKESNRHGMMRKLIAESVGKRILIEKLQVDVSLALEFTWETRPQNNDFLNTLISCAKRMIEQPQQVTEEEVGKDFKAFLEWKSCLSEDEKAALREELDWKQLIEEATTDIYEQLEAEDTKE